MITPADPGVATDLWKRRVRREIFYVKLFLFIGVLFAIVGVGLQIVLQLELHTEIPLIMDHTTLLPGVSQGFMGLGIFSLLAGLILAKQNKKKFGFPVCPQVYKSADALFEDPRFIQVQHQQQNSLPQRPPPPPQPPPLFIGQHPFQQHVQHQHHLQQQQQQQQHQPPPIFQQQPPQQQNFQHQPQTFLQQHPPNTEAPQHQSYFQNEQQQPTGDAYVATRRKGTSCTLL